MPAQRVLLAVSVFTNICNSTSFSKIPIKLQNEVYSVHKTRSKKENIAIVFDLISRINVVIQLVQNLFHPNNGNLARTFFYGFLSCSIFGETIYTFGFYVQASEFCCLLNCMSRKSDKIFNKNVKRSQPTDYLLVTLTIWLQLTIILQFLVLIPAVDISLIVLYEDQHRALYIIFFALKLFTLIRICSTLLITLPTCIVSVKELCDNLVTVLSIVKTESSVKCNVQLRLLIMHYRQVQIFTILVNECFSTYFWPGFQFIGASASVGLAFVFIVFRNVLSIFIQTSLILIALFILSVICFVFDMGSRPMPLSSKILAGTRLLIGGKECKWFSKFTKSCPCIALKVGQFHKIDRKRVPSIIRFVLQRTVFLVLKSRPGNSL